MRRQRRAIAIIAVSFACLTAWGAGRAQEANAPPPVSARRTNVAGEFRKADSTLQAHWVGAPWSTVRDGAEADGSRPMPIFRREFRVQQKPVSAVLRIAGLGQWEVTVDGKSLLPGAGLHQSWTDYRKRVGYTTLDVTSSLGAGQHALGVMLGNGMYNVQHTAGRYTKFEGTFGAPKVIAELRLRYPGGQVEVIGTDTDWSVARGPVTFSSTYGGEDFDARRVQTGWDTAGFHGEGWEAANPVASPGGALQAEIAPDVRSPAEYKVVKQSTPRVNTWVYDLGQNFAGVPRVRVQGPAGAVLKLTPGELLNADGTVSQASSGKGMWWSYTLRGGGEESWFPHFGYYGFRYLQAEWVQLGVQGPLGGRAAQVLEVEGEPLHSRSGIVGSFTSSSELLNSIHQLIVHAMWNNEMSVFTDCPHREKLGWLEQDHLQASGLMFNNDLEALYRATDRNMEDAQDASGMVPTIVPQYTKFGPKYAVYDDSPEWGSAAVLAPWAAYRFYGDKQELARSYPMMQAWVRYLESRATDGIVSYGLGDWYDIGPGAPGFGKNTTLGVTGTLMLVECAQAMQRIALLLGKLGDAAGYGALAQREAAAFQAKFWDAEHGWYDRGSQTANAMPLALGIVPQAQRAAVLGHVVADIEAHQDHVTTGEIGYPYLLRTLMQAGRNDVVMRLMIQRTPPSYGAQIGAGATALTEAWDANPHSSQDHFMLGGGEEWFYRALGGMDFDLSRPDAAKRVTIRPAVADGVDWVRCGFQSKLGKIESDWKRGSSVTAFDVIVPVTSTVVLPLPSSRALLKLANGEPPEHARGVHVLTRTPNSVTLEVAAGTYHFTVAEAAP